MSVHTRVYVKQMQKKISRIDRKFVRIILEEDGKSKD